MLQYWSQRKKCLNWTGINGAEAISNVVSKIHFLLEKQNASRKKQNINNKLTEQNNFLFFSHLFLTVET
jgi:hypothetical protein